MAYKGGKLIGQQSFKHFMGEDRIKSVINFALRYIADLDIPIKRYANDYETTHHVFKSVYVSYSCFNQGITT